MSTHGIVEKCPGLSETYKKNVKQLFEKYYPLEICEKLSNEKKIPLMKEWYEQGHTALLEEGITKEALENTVKEHMSNGNIMLRKGVRELFAVLKQHEVPMLIFSAGIANVIDILLSHYFHLLYTGYHASATNGEKESAEREPAAADAEDMRHYYKECVHIVGNWLLFDETDRTVGFSEPLIHMFNKTEEQFNKLTLPKEIEEENGTAQSPTRRQYHNYHKQVNQRKHVLLLGDGIGDVHMADLKTPAAEETNGALKKAGEGEEIEAQGRVCKHEVILKIGFLNHKVKELLPKYREIYDVIILNDGDFEFINEHILKKIAEKQQAAP